MVHVAYEKASITTTWVDSAKRRKARRRRRPGTGNRGRTTIVENLMMEMIAMQIDLKDTKAKTKMLLCGCGPKAIGQRQWNNDVSRMHFVDSASFQVKCLLISGFSSLSDQFGKIPNFKSKPLIIRSTCIFASSFLAHCLPICETSLSVKGILLQSIYNL